MIGKRCQARVIICSARALAGNRWTRGQVQAGARNAKPDPIAEVKVDIGGKAFLGNDFRVSYAERARDRRTGNSYARARSRRGFVGRLLAVDNVASDFAGKSGICRCVGRLVRKFTAGHLSIV